MLGLLLKIEVFIVLCCNVASTVKLSPRSAMLLTNAQEPVLIQYINELSARGLHPTPQMLENLVVEIVGHPIEERL